MIHPSFFLGGMGWGRLGEGTQARVPQNWKRHGFRPLFSGMNPNSLSKTWDVSRPSHPVAEPMPVSVPDFPPPMPLLGFSCGLVPRGADTVARRARRALWGIQWSGLKSIFAGTARVSLIKCICYADYDTRIKIAILENPEIAPADQRLWKLGNFGVQVAAPAPTPAPVLASNPVPSPALSPAPVTAS